MSESLTRSSFQNGASVATARPWHSRMLVPCIHIPSHQTKRMNMDIIFVVLSADACASTTRVQRGRPWCSVLSARFVAFYTLFQCRKKATPLQDWFHESCLNLRERPASRDPSPDAQPAAPIDDAPVQNSTEVNATDENDDDASTSSGLPPERNSVLPTMTRSYAQRASRASRQCVRTQVRGARLCSCVSTRRRSGKCWASLLRALHHQSSPSLCCPRMGTMESLPTHHSHRGASARALLPTGCCV
jgi:hypothetical protein